MSAGISAVTVAFEPLSKKTGVTIDASYADKEYPALAHHLLSKGHFVGKLVLICWHHGEIPGFAGALRAKPGSYPAAWPPAVFNLILQFEFANGVPSITQITEPF